MKWFAHTNFLLCHTCVFSFVKCVSSDFKLLSAPAYSVKMEFLSDRRLFVEMVAGKSLNFFSMFFHLADERFFFSQF